MPEILTSEFALVRRSFLVGARVLSLTAALAARGGGDEGGSATQPVTRADIDKAISTPTELTFWTCVP